MNYKKSIIWILPLGLMGLVACRSGMNGTKRPTVSLSLPALETDREAAQTVHTLEADSLDLELTSSNRVVTVNMNKDDRQFFSRVERTMDSATYNEVSNYVMKPIEVVGYRTRNMAERNGKIQVDFVLGVPRKLISRNHMLTVTPLMIREGNIDSLNEVRFTGKKFRQKQLDAYARYNDYLNRIIPDSADFYSNFVKTKDFERYMGKLADERNALQNKWNELERLKGGNSLLARRFRMFNTEMNANADRLEEKLWDLEDANREYSFRGWLVRTAGKAPMFWMERDVEPIEADLLRRQQGIEARLAALDGRDSAAIVQGFIDHKKIADNERLKAEKDEVFRDLVRQPYNPMAKLDRVMEMPDSTFFIYRQEVKPDENSKRIYVTATGKEVSYRNRMRPLPPTDTLTYLVSSMSSFLTERTRYVKKIVKRDLEMDMDVNLAFGVGKWDIEEKLADNRSELAKLRSTIYSLMNDSLYVMDSLHLAAYCSPEGPVATNRELATRRGEAVVASLRRWLTQQYDSLAAIKEYTLNDNLEVTQAAARVNPVPELMRRVRVLNGGEDWQTLRDMVSANEGGLIKSPAKVLKVMDANRDADRREYLIRIQYPADYAAMRKSMYPKLRRVNFKFFMRRKGMLEESVVTNEVDTVYARGLEMLHKRRYEEAIELLRPYEDENTALAYLSLGYDKAAYRILSGLKEPSADMIYLTAVVAARLGKDKEALDLLTKACELKPMLRFRANLDPEMSELVRRYGLFKDEE